MVSKAFNLLHSAKRNGIHISLNNGELQVKVSAGTTIDPEFLREIKDNKELITRFLKNSQWKSKKVEAFENELRPFDRSSVRHIPLSFSQERLWFIEKLGGTLQYHIPAVLRLKGKLNLEALQHSLKRIVLRHEALRTAVREHEGHGYQYVMNEAAWKLHVSSYLIDHENTGALQKYIEKLINEPFDLSGDYMLRANLLRLAEEEYILVVTMHHIASDGWSLSIIVKEVVELYESYVQDRPAQLPVLELQYADYAFWQRTWLQGEILDKKISYWKQKLNGVLPLQLPADYDRPVIQSMKGSVTSFHIDKRLSDQLLQICQQQETTMFMTLLAAFKVLLYRYSGQNDICVGTPIANRNYREVEELIGFFVNTLALRSNLDNNISFTELLQQVRVTTLEAYEHQEVPFEKVVDVVMKQRDMSRSPLFQVMFIFQNTPDIPELHFGEVSLSQYAFAHNTSKFDLTFSVTESTNGMQVLVEYCTDLYNEKTIGRLVGHFQQLLNSIAKAPHLGVDHLAMLTLSEEEQLLHDFNKNFIPYSPAVNIVNLFEARVENNPAAVAVLFENEQLTYQQLNQRSNQLAHYLRSRGVKKETLVPVCIDRSLDMIVAILGILKAGGAFIPIDPEYPANRISYMLEDAGAGMIVTNKHNKSKFRTDEAILVIELDEANNELWEQPAENLQLVLRPDQLAYLIYTSGSTGKPKGVMVEHGNLANLLQSISAEIDFKIADSFLSVTTYSFDICYLELFVPLISGGKLIVVPRVVAIDGFRLKDSLAAYHPTHMQATPSTWQLLQNCAWENPEEIKILAGGEALNEDLKQYLTERGSVWNLYGPTETTIWSTVKKLQAEEKVSIGTPIANNRIYILDKVGNVSPIGVAGEICIGGVQVSRGYLNRPQLTAEKFITDNFSNQPGARIYKTGDLGKWQLDGNIECLGRMDDQVKIRGYRIELGEIETVLREHPSVRLAVVLAKEDVEGNKRLVGYIVADGLFERENILSYLKTRLPDYMIPALWVEMEVFPLTPNGKIDRNAFPDPDISKLLSDQYLAPRNETEWALAGIWGELLSVKEVGVHDNFFQLGGHSLSALQVISLIRKDLQVELAIMDLFMHPTIAELALHLRKQTGGLLYPSIEALPERPGFIPLSFSQERLWFIDQLEGSLQYHVPAVIRMKGSLDEKALEFALRNIIQRHEALRTVIKEHDGQGYQYIMDESDWQLEIVDGSVVKDEPGALQQYIQQLIRKPFDLSKDYMLRASLIRFDEQNQVLVVTMHHIASDAWSIPIIIEEVGIIYGAYVKGQPAGLPKLSLQYADYSIWQRNYLRGELLDRKIQYWKTKLEGVAALQLPTDFARPVIRSSRGTSAKCLIDKNLSKQLHHLSRQQDCTLFMTLLATFKVMLYRYSGQQDISVGTSVANRNKHELENLVGFFVNTITFRSEVNGDALFTELLQQVKATTLQAYEHQEVPFEKVVEAVVKDRDPARSPLFQVMLVMRNTPQSPDLQLGDVVFSGEAFEQTTVKFDITFFISETSNGLHITVEYSTDLYMASTIERMMDHFNKLLDSVVKMPHQKIGLLPMLTSGEQHRLLEEFTGSQVAYPKEKSIVELFEEQVQKAPGNIAAVFEQQRLTYGELNARSNQLAHYLRSRGVQPGSLVPLCINRSVEMLVGMLGILKAGAAYVPIDIEFPPERISYMMEDTSATIVVSSKNSSSKIYDTAFAGIDIIELDDDANGLGSQPSTNLDELPAPRQLAYVIYTSGSTGKPKGVMIEHQSLVDYVFGLNDRTGIDKCRSYALVSTIATDLGNTVIYSSLVFGGTLHLFSKETVSNAAMLHHYFSTHTIDCLKIVPSHWKALCEEERLLLPAKLLVFGGEALPADTVEDIRLSGSACKVVNHYGPTETTIGKLLHVVNNDIVYNGTVPIGRPFSNTRVYVLGKELQLCPVGVLGQLYIAGDGLARGYLNNVALTTEKFIKDPFSQKNSTLMYGTGDLVKWLPDGNILFAGRVDDQVKIRGYRVELGEIETILQQCEQVSQAVVLAREDKQGTRQLVGYVVPEGGWLDREAIHAHLKEKLPDYMIPAILIELERLPLTANGKVDRKALPDPDAAKFTADRYEAPRNERERKLTIIWEQVLETDQVGIQDDFFVLGGHSLLAIRLISAIRKEFAVEIPISDVFDYPTIATLSAQLANQAGNSIVPVITVSHPRPGHIPLSFSQERLWFIHQMDGSVQYHVPAVLRLKGQLDIAALSFALQNIVNRHEVLRTVIMEENGLPYQFVKPPGEWQLLTLDGSAFEKNQVLLQNKIQELISAPFNLSQDYMLRAAIITINEQEHILVTTMHHIASDGWSTAILVKEVVELYATQGEKAVAKLTPLPVQYADFAIWQRNYLKGEILDKKLAYWKEKLQDVAPLQLPSDYPRPVIQSNRGATAAFRVEKELYAQLLELSREEGATLFMTLLAAFKVLLHRYSNQQDICVGTAVAGRQQQEVEPLIGFFINTLALRSEVKSQEKFTDLLNRVKATTMEAFNNQEVPFEKVVETVVKERNLGFSPLFQVMFALQNTPAVPALLLGDVQLSREPFSQNSTKFDISVVLTENAVDLQGSIQYCTDLYNEATISRMMGHFKQILNSVVTDRNQQIGILRMLTTEEEIQLLPGGKSEVSPNTDETILDAFRRQVLLNPEAIALVQGEEKLSYKELDTRSNRFAHYLQAMGVKAETMVPVCMKRSPAMITALLGILKAGGAYVPVDPDYPAERIKYMLEDTGATLVITSKECEKNLPASEGVTVVQLEKEWQAIKLYPENDPGNIIKPAQLCYVIYTSGSTGVPKGVMIEHRGLLNLVTWHNDVYKVSGVSRATAMAGVGFDAFGWEVWPYLSAGAALFIIDDELRLSPPELVEFFITRNITHSFISTAVVQEFVNASRYKAMSLEYLLTGGDKLMVSDLSGIEYRFVNNYGPTENTVVATSYTLSNDDIGRIPPIGKPVRNTFIYILSDYEQLVPAGVSGEICIGGSGLARGYLKRPELMAEKFTRNPFHTGEAAVLYKTGDLGRWLPGGNIEYLGRVDDQVKIRGYRIEPSEIEMVLQQSEWVRQALVIATEDSANNRKLVAYIVAEGTFKKEALISWLKGRMPAYMIPAAWVEMDQFPLTPNGKIDKKNLPAPTIGGSSDHQFIAPGNDLEKKLVEIWQNLLGVDNIGIGDNFFERGGNSLLAMRMVPLIERNLLLSIPIRVLFQFTTISELSKYLSIQKINFTSEENTTEFQLLDV